MSDNNSKKKYKASRNKGIQLGNKMTNVTKNRTKTYSDAKRKLTRDDLAEVGKIADNGNYYIDYKIPWYYKLLWLIDSFITGLIYLMTAVALGWVVDDYAVKGLDTNDSKFFVFIQACGEVLYLIIVFFAIVFIYGSYLPDFSFYAPPEHSFLKNYSAGFFVIFGLFALDPTLTSKLQYVFYGTTS